MAWAAYTVSEFMLTNSSVRLQGGQKLATTKISKNRIKKLASGIRFRRQIKVSIRHYNIIHL